MSSKDQLSYSIKCIEQIDWDLIVNDAKRKKHDLLVSWILSIFQLEDIFVHKILICYYGPSQLG